MSRLGWRQVFLLLITAFSLLAVVQYGSVYLDALQFDDFVEHEVKFAGRAKRSVEDIRVSIVKRSDEMGIGLRPGDVQITRTGPSFTLNLSYKQPVDMILYHHQWTFNVSLTGEMFDR